MCASDPNQEPIPTESDPVGSTTPDRPETNSGSTEAEQVLRKLPIKKIAVIAAIVFGVLLTVSILLAIILSVAGSSKDPIRKACEMRNRKSIDYEDVVEAYTNGWLSSEFLGIADEIEDTEKGKAFLDSWREEGSSRIRIDLTFTDEEPLDEDDCEAFQVRLRSLGEAYRALVEQYENSSTDLKEAKADMAGLTVKAMDRIYAHLDRIASELEDCVVSEGVKHTFVVRTVDKESDYEAEDDSTAVVFKVNGHWVTESYPKNLPHLMMDGERTNLR